uniref:Kynureninase n=1 Tax=Ciona savignyi TaxID=51511 RepID=H2Y9D3_CIOSA
MNVHDEEFHKILDDGDELSKFRERFEIPKLYCVYFCGHSLGLQPKSTESHVQQVLQSWKQNANQCRYVTSLPLVYCDNQAKKGLSELVGCYESEVVAMNSLTTNLHLLMTSFYQPTKYRYKILIEQNAFPSDYYVVASQIRLAGYDEDESLILVKPRQVSLACLLHLIEKEGDSIALILLPGVYFITGQAFDMKAITEAGHKKGCYVGYDLAHAVGNIELHLHEWGVDFACWCTYKYLNSGPGGIGAAFLHRRFDNTKMNKLLGWWGHKESTRFEMTSDFDFAPGIDSYRLSNPPALLVVCFIASLNEFLEAGGRRLREKRFLLTGYLEYLLKHHFSEPSNTSKVTVDIVTPLKFAERGCQLSIRFSCPVHQVAEELRKRGMIFDIRKPDVMRLTPVPLYNRFYDVYRFVDTLRSVLKHNIYSVFSAIKIFYE